MATLNFRIKKSVQNRSKIYMILSLKRGCVFESKLPFEIQANEWDNTRKYPKQNSAQNKNLKSKLLELEKYISDALDSGKLKGEQINKDWFIFKLNEFFNPSPLKEEGSIVNHVQLMIDNASTRRVKGRDSIGISKSRVKGYENFRKIIEDFEKVQRKRLTFLDVNSQFVDDFTNYLIRNKKYARNYAGKQLSNLKTVCLDADRLQIPVNRFTYHIHGFKESSTERRIITLTRQELRKIEDKDMPNEMLENAKKWLLIGCEIGQRGEDMLKINWSEIYMKEEYHLIDVYQSKTKKWVTVPILSPYVIDLIKNKPPRKISLTNLNSYIKKVCETAAINTLVEGKKYIGGGNERRVIVTQLPKYNLITSHCFRRTFVTLNDEQIDRQSVMEISGHSKESSYLYYINKRVDKSEKALNFARQKGSLMKRNG